MAFGKSVENDVRTVVLSLAQGVLALLLGTWVLHASCDWLDDRMDETQRKIRAEEREEWREYLEERRKRRESRGKD